jgi:hypothetical protein
MDINLACLLPPHSTNLASQQLPHALVTTMSSAMDNLMSYLRVPVLASSGIAAVLSGLLYFKQK